MSSPLNLRSLEALLTISRGYRTYWQSYHNFDILIQQKHGLPIIPSLSGFGISPSTMGMLPTQSKVLMNICEACTGSMALIQELWEFSTFFAPYGCFCSIDQIGHTSPIHTQLCHAIWIIWLCRVYCQCLLHLDWRHKCHLDGKTVGPVFWHHSRPSSLVISFVQIGRIVCGLDIWCIR